MTKNIDLNFENTDIESVENQKKHWKGLTSTEARWEIYNGDSAQIIKDLPSGSIDCAITSPPYFWLRDYGVDGQIGLEDSVQEYVDAIADVMDTVKEALNPEGTLFMNIGDTYYSGKGQSQGKDRKSNKRRFGLRAVDKSGGMGIGLQRKSMIGIPWRVAIEMATRGWVIRSSIIWHREKCLPESVKDRPSRSYEYVFMFVKSRKYYFNKQELIEQKVEEDMWTIPARPKSGGGLDTAPYPDALVERCLKIGCKPNGTVLDPFLGSGTTCRVAAQMGYSSIGIDLNHEFCEYSALNMENI
jgi:DNA modification methylase